MIPAEWKKFAPPVPVLEPGQNWHVFLSYRSVNRGWVLSLYDVLTELGYKVFLDQYVLKVGYIDSGTSERFSIEPGRHTYLVKCGTRLCVGKKRIFYDDSESYK